MSRRWSDQARANRWRNWYIPPPGHSWLDGEGRRPRRSTRAFETEEAARAAASEDAASLGPSVRYIGAFRSEPALPDPLCETCNGYGCHPADGGAYPCPDCTSQDPSPGDNS